MTGPLTLIPVQGVGEVREGDELGSLLAGALTAQECPPADGDALVIAQKVVSKAEGRTRDLNRIEPGERALAIGTDLQKDPRLVQAVLDEAREVLRAENGVLIVETTHGWVCANAGIDASNVPGDDVVALLPEDGDASARRIRAEVRAATGAAPAVVIADTFGRAWRLGQADVAIGCAGLAPLDDWRGRTDREGRELEATQVAIADELAAAADLCRDKAIGIPAVLARGLERYVTQGDGPGAAALRRPRRDDLFR